MADVLSQSEIDALLSALSAGELEAEELPKEEEKQKVKVYDFRSPQKFSKEHIRALEVIHDNFARIISNYLTAQVRKNTKINIQTVEQITYEEFIHSVPNPTIMTVFKMPPLNGTVLFEMNPTFSFNVIDILLGGNGERTHVNKEFTDIDKNIIFNVASGLVSNLKLAWEDVLDVSIEIENIETNPALNQTLAPNEPVALITFSVEMGKSSTFIHLCIPYLSIEKFLDKLVMQNWFQSNEDEENEHIRKKIRNRINNVEVDVAVQLGKTDIIVDDFLRLAAGDVLVLDNKASSPVDVFIENELCYYAKPGIMGKKMGISILDSVRKDVESDE
ncbi:flagellar motor switch protein FliM [Inconstantimicrobium mannanitabidum]|uniref:Flagellar motor switch protein FliM n=1 Tax=Inconstantimicrobium mannanitabidum TaxID=1604901 RepID=A0ACB5R8L8_9CLOT|nr:flagellar motor switch protein FliM [Clostridium sp. TW13]GKX65455.1 flagellar motor switch protein FliM [Clostridium sp. TW13]